MFEVKIMRLPGCSDHVVAGSYLWRQREVLGPANYPTLGTHTESLSACTKREPPIGRFAFKVI